MHETRTVGIIGASIAGLATAKVLRQIGFTVCVLEKEADVGGVWSACRRYPGLTTQNPRETYEFSDFPMPSDYPEWPTGEQVQSYLHSYAEKFGLIAHIRLNTRVESARWPVDVPQLASDNGSYLSSVHIFALTPRLMRRLTAG
jgi:dimethylaniline monooxygenase (N-oxide forming)